MLQILPKSLRNYGIFVKMQSFQETYLTDESPFAIIFCEEGVVGAACAAGSTNWVKTLVQP
jgi:hypothetical protein